MKEILAIFTLVAGASLIGVGQDGSKSTDNQKKQTATPARSKTTRSAFGVNKVAPQTAVVSSLDLRAYPAKSSDLSADGRFLNLFNAAKLYVIDANSEIRAPFFLRKERQRGEQ
jgi:hypothetical protein